MSNFSFGLAARAVIPAATEFIQNWAPLARKSGYCRHRLAKNLQVSTRTLDRYFEKHLSLSAQQWLSESRLVEAYAQVMTGKPLKEISYDLGFKKSSNFTRLFKARFGIVPSLLLGRCAAEPSIRPKRSVLAPAPRRELLKRSLTIAPSVRILSKGKMKTKLFVGNLAPDVTREMIESIFVLHGSVAEVYLATNRITARCRGFAFVTMDTKEGACKAMEGLNGSMNNGRFIKVHEAPERPDESVVENYIPRREFRKLY